MQVLFSEYARQELLDAIEYYEHEYLGLGKQFEAEARKTVLRIVEYPEAGSVVRGDVRQSLLSKFPYKLLYAIEKEHIIIIAVAHQHRRPDYWIDRNK